MNSLPPNGHLNPIDPLTLYPEIKKISSSKSLACLFFLPLTMALVCLALTMMVAPPDKMKVNTKCHIVVHKLTGFKQSMCLKSKVQSTKTCVNTCTVRRNTHIQFELCVKTKQRIMSYYPRWPRVRIINRFLR